MNSSINPSQSLVKSIYNRYLRSVKQSIGGYIMPAEELSDGSTGIVSKFLLNVVNTVVPVLVTTGLFTAIGSLNQLKDAISDLKTQAAVSAEQSRIGFETLKESVKREAERNDKQDQLLMEALGKK